jgi:hypothetical protein
MNTQENFILEAIEPEVADLVVAGRRSFFAK